MEICKLIIYHSGTKSAPGEAFLQSALHGEQPARLCDDGHGESGSHVWQRSHSQRCHLLRADRRAGGSCRSKWRRKGEKHTQTCKQTYIQHVCLQHPLYTMISHSKALISQCPSKQRNLIVQKRDQIHCYPYFMLVF